MKTLHCIILGFLLAISASSALAQLDSTHKPRRADSVATFFVSDWGPFGKWPGPAESFGTMGMPDTSFRYYNVDDTLGLNAEDRPFWDFADHPTPPETVLG